MGFIVKKQNQSMTLDGTTLTKVFGDGDGGSDTFPFAVYENVVQTKNRNSKREGDPLLKQVPQGSSFAGCQIVKSERQGIYKALSIYMRDVTQDEIAAFEGKVVPSEPA